MLVFNETWYTVIAIQEDDKNMIKRVEHCACFHPTMVTNLAI